MKRVLATFVVAFAMVLAVSLNCPNAYASDSDGVGSPSMGGVQSPQGGQGVDILCGGGNAEGDPDDLGGGFRSTSGQIKQSINEIKPPVTLLVHLMLSAQRVWMMILR
jgi:hypothetical protein